MIRNFKTLRPFLRFNSTSNLLSKYQSKLQVKAKQEGVTIDELKNKYQKEIEKVKKEVVNPLEPFQPSTNSTIKDRGKVTKEKAPYKTLDDFITLDKIKELPKDEISKIWTARFATKERALHAILDSYQFAQMYVNAFRYPNFLLPIPKKHEGKDGYEMEFVQWSFVGPSTIHCMFTTLAEYKLHNEYAKPHTTLTFHQELAKDKDIVLMNGLSEKDGGLTMQEAQFLVINLQRFYSGTEKDKLEIVRQFSTGDGFDVDNLIKLAMAM